MTQEEEQSLVYIYLKREWEIKKARNEHEYEIRVQQKIAEMKDKKQ